VRAMTNSRFARAGACGRARWPMNASRAKLGGKIADEVRAMTHSRFCTRWRVWILLARDAGCRMREAGGRRQEAE
jgi:hypothetical protein